MQSAPLQRALQLSAIGFNIEWLIRMGWRRQCHYRHQAGFPLEHGINESDEICLAAVCEQHLQRWDDPERVRGVDVREQEGDNVFTNATPIVRASAGRLAHSVCRQRRADLIRFVL